jgi:hypothetical protein
LLVAACQQEDAEEKQRKTIESYVGDSYETFDGIYFKQLRHPLCDTAIIACTLTAEGDTVLCDTTQLPACLRVTRGSRVTFLYTARILRGAVFATTDSAVAASSNIFPQPPYTVVVGQEGIVAGVERALLHTVLSDSVHVVFPFTLGYGEENHVGIVPPNSAQEWTISIIGIN